MEEYRNRVIKLHAIYSRISVNLLVKLGILVNLLVKLTNIRYRLGGHGGGAYPLYYEPLPDCIVAPRNQGKTLQLCMVGVCGETTMRDSGGE